MNTRVKLGLLSVLVAVGVFSCNRGKDILPTSDTLAIIDGDTVLYRNDTFLEKLIQQDLFEKKNFISVGDTLLKYKKFQLRLPVLLPDLSKIGGEDGQVRYVSFGGSLSAGYRDGGYFNEGIDTSFPNLLAIQMGISSFKQPKFSPENFNGYSRKVRTSYNPTNGPLPKVKYVKNNSAVRSFSGLTIDLADNITDVISLDNFAVPDISPWLIIPFKHLAYVNKFDTQMWFQPGQKFTLRYENRDVTYEKSKSLFEYATGRNIDFFTLEAFNIPEYNKILGSLSEDSFHPELYEGKENFVYVAPEAHLIHRLKERGVKYGVIINSPDFYEFPMAFSINKDARELIRGKTIYFTGGSFNGGDNNIILLPTSEIDSLLSPIIDDNLMRGLTLSNPLRNRGSFIEKSSIKNSSSSYIDRQNRQLAFFSEYYGYPLVDLNTVYKKINRGQYVTHDGIKVDPDWPDGNFYSLDGIYPTPFGNAIIANEIIKVMNEFYNTAIPFIETRSYLNKN